MKSNVLYVDFSNKYLLIKDKTTLDLIKIRILTLLMFGKITIKEIYKEARAL
jgi:hypothetical protein